MLLLSFSYLGDNALGVLAKLIDLVNENGVAFVPVIQNGIRNIRQCRYGCKSRHFKRRTIEVTITGDPIFVMRLLSCITSHNNCTGR